MKENKLKRFLNKKRCYTLIVVMILLVLSYIGLFKVGVEYLLNKGNSEYVFFNELVAKVYDRELLKEYSTMSLAYVDDFK